MRDREHAFKLQASSPEVRVDEPDGDAVRRGGAACKGSKVFVGALKRGREAERQDGI
jgi:hypothetical protein